MEGASVESQDLTIRRPPRVIVVYVVAVVLGIAIALVGVGAAVATLYAAAWSALGNESEGAATGYKFLFWAVPAATLLLELGLGVATKRVARRLY